VPSEEVPESRNWNTSFQKQGIASCLAFAIMGLQEGRLMSKKLAMKRVVRSFPVHAMEEGAGFLVHRPFPVQELSFLDPFLLLDEMGPQNYAPGEAKGAPDHPHRGFETVTYMLEGEFEHEDSAGNKGIIQAGDVQIMSAGTGIHHSEFNANPTEPVELFQIWVMPKLKNITPRYDQRTFDPTDFVGQWKTVVSPLGSNIDSLQVNQDTYFNLTAMELDETIEYSLHGPRQGAFLIVIEGTLEVANNTLGRRDAIGISETDRIQVKAASANTKALLIEIPMVW
jgi:redox-sensitive bicupin YhaK (pirin superfamily)